MRLFIEAVVEPSALDEVWSVGNRMRSEPGFPVGAVRWVKPEAMHLTLRFLGDVDRKRLEGVMTAVARLEGSGRIELRMVEVGSFGARSPRIVWVGLARDQGFEALRHLRRRLDQALNGAGFEPEQASFRPHLTLGRVRRQATRQDRASIRAAVEAAAELDIATSLQRVALVESTLLKDGPRYRRLAFAEL